MRKYLYLYSLILTIASASFSQNIGKLEAEKCGIDPVKEQYYQSYAQKTKGKAHPDIAKSSKRNVLPVKRRNRAVYPADR